MVLQSQLISQPPVDDVVNLGSLPPTLFYFAPFHALPFTHCLFFPHATLDFPTRLHEQSTRSLVGGLGWSDDIIEIAAF